MSAAVGDHGAARGRIADVAFEFRALGQHVRIGCPAGLPTQAVRANFAGFAGFASLAGEAAIGAAAPELDYRITDRGTSPPSFALSRGHGDAVTASGVGELLFRIEQDLVVRLQHLRQDLLFLHAAAVERDGKVYVLAGDSGHGKSTTTWGLLHHGLRYLSDELCPLELSGLRVQPYPHALCLKRPPPPCFPLPAGTLDAGRRLHVPVTALPGGWLADAGPLAAVFFVRHDARRAQPAVEALGAGESAIRLYANALNALAHPNAGLDAVADIARRVPCYSLASAELGASCALLAERISALVH